MMNSLPGIILLLIFSVAPGIVKCQWPQCDIYITSIEAQSEKYKKPSYINSFFSNGYNNQPYITDDRHLFITSGYGTDKTDILCLNLNNESFFAFTQTEKISEFSPVIMPDKKNLSVVRIEENGKSQTLWSYPLDRSNSGKNLLSSLDNIGYYTWIDSQWVALFLVDSLHSLALANINTGKITFLQEGIGRCIKSYRNQIFFTQKTSEGNHVIKKYNLSSQIIDSVYTLPLNVEDFEILANGDFLYAFKAKIFRSSLLVRREPVAIFDAEKFGINNIKRIACKGSDIVFVNQL